MRRRFFVEGFSNSSTATMRGETAEHLGRVLRAEAGQLYELSDGRRVWLAKIERVAIAKRGQSRIEFTLIEPVPASEPILRINLLISLVKFDRFEWCIEKATELGANEIVPLAASRTDKPLIAAGAKRHERWQKILLESAQQSRRLRPPVLHEIGTPEQTFRKYSRGLKIVLSERQTVPALRRVLPAAGLPAEEGEEASAALAIGPEGGWTDEEIRVATASGFAEASLGENILRTETAVLASLSILAFALEPRHAAAE
jgi:16S rRNA (uracil1498-N3)-methyltransferase